MSSLRHEGLAINYGERATKPDEGGKVKFDPYEKGDRKGFSHAQGGNKKFSDSFNTEALAIPKGGRGVATKSSHPLKGRGGGHKKLYNVLKGEGGGRKKFQTRNFPIL